ncbi:MAG: TMEM14 family protein [Puniceicoccaceae bacterium]
MAAESESPAPADRLAAGRVTRKRRSFAVTLLAYGLFLLALGIAGYVNNPDGAKTALVSGGVFGGVHLLWAWLWNRRQRIARYGAGATLVLVLAASTWRMTVSWQAFLGGDETKRFVAFILTAMFLGTLRVFLRYLALPKA